MKHDWENITKPVDNTKWPTPLPEPKLRCRRCGFINKMIFYVQSPEEDECDLVMAKKVIEE
jgi:hypothetical protein